MFFDPSVKATVPLCLSNKGSKAQCCSMDELLKLKCLFLVQTTCYSLGWAFNKFSLSILAEARMRPFKSGLENLNWIRDLLCVACLLIDIEISCFTFDVDKTLIVLIQIRVTLPKLKLNPLLVMQQHNAKLSLCSAYVARIGLLGPHVLFSMRQSVCVHFVRVRWHPCACSWRSATSATAG